MEQDSEPTETNYDGYEVISESEAAYFNSYEDVEVMFLWWTINYASKL